MQRRPLLTALQRNALIAPNQALHALAGERAAVFPPPTEAELHAILTVITSRWRAAVTPAGRGSGAKAAAPRTPAERHRAMTWAQRLKRVFKLDLTSCEGCGGQVRVLACIEDPLVIGKILAHLETQQAVLVGEGRRPEVRGPPPGRLTLG